MSLNANDAQGGLTKVETMEAGTYPARVVQIIDLGVQKQPAFQGEEKPDRQNIMMTYEFVDEFMKGEDGEDDLERPRWLSEDFPLFPLSSERAKSTQRYLALDPNVTHNGDFSHLLGTPVNVTVVESPSKKDPTRVYNNVAAVSAMRKKDADKCPPLVNESRLFDLDSPDVEVFLALPKWIQDRVKNGVEYEGSQLANILENRPDTAGETSAEEDDEEAPF